MEGHAAGTLSWHSARALLSHGPHPTEIAGELRDPRFPVRMPEITTLQKGVFQGRDQRWKGGLEERETGALGVSEGGLGRRLAGEPMGGTGLSGDAKGQREN